MKNLNLICAVLLFAAITSCKKRSNQDSVPIKLSIPAVAAVKDSISYTIDGKTYTASGIGHNPVNTGGEDANRKLIYPDTNQKHVYSLIGSPDSILHFQESVISSNNTTITVFFVKKFIKQPITNYWPPLNDVLTMFAVGKYTYAEDFEWQNSQNGIAFNVVANNKLYSSYNSYNGINTIAIPRGFQKNSSFEITNFIQAKWGYNLEARFNAVVIDPTTGQQKQLVNGYLRLNIAPEYSVNSL